MLSLKDIEKEYNGRKILNGVNLEFPSQGLFFIVGASGAGKTSLLNVIGMLDKNFKGDIIWNNQIVSRYSEKELNKYHLNELGFIFQDFNLIEYLSVKENIELQVFLKSGKFIWDNSVNNEEGLEHLNLLKVKNNMAKDLSGGEKQRVAIARAIYRDYSIILADEPTGNLDKSNSDIIFSYLTQLAKEKLVIVVTHNEKAAYEFGDGVIELQDGEIIKNTCVLHNEHHDEQTKDRLDDGKIKQWGLLRLNKKYMKFNFRFVWSSLVMASLCVLTVVLFLCAFNSINHINDVVNKSVLESDKITVVNEDECFRKSKLSDEFLKKIKAQKNIKYCLPYYEETLLLSSENSSETIYADYTVVDNSPIFKNRYEDLIGRLPERKGEICISKEVAEHLFPNQKEIVGKKISCKTFENRYYDYKIVGYRQDKKENTLGAYIAKAEADRISNSLAYMKYQIFTLENNKKYNITETMHIENNDTDYSGKYKVLFGHDIEGKHQVLLNINAVNMYLEALGIQANYSKKQIAEGRISKEDQQLLFNENLCISGTNNNVKLDTVSIVGIYSSSSKDQNFGFILDEQLLEKLKAVHNFYLDIYVNSTKASEWDKIYKIIDAYGYSYISNTGNVGARVTMKVSMMFQILMVIMVFVVLLSVIILRFITKNMLSKRIYEIGVLKSLGVSNRNILFLFLSQSTFVAIIASIIACIFGFIVLKANWITYDGISLLSYNGWISVVAIIFGVFICDLSGICDMYAIARKNVIDCIKEK